MRNSGAVDHELLVLKTDTPFNKLPIVDSGDPPVPVKSGADKVDEGTKVGETGDPNLKPGQTRTFTIKNLPLADTTYSSAISPVTTPWACGPP